MARDIKVGDVFRVDAGLGAKFDGLLVRVVDIFEDDEWPYKVTPVDPECGIFNADELEEV